MQLAVLLAAVVSAAALVGLQANSAGFLGVFPAVSLAALILPVRLSADVGLIDLPGSRDDGVAGRAAAVTSYLRARLQSIGDSGSKNATTQGVL